MGRHVAAYALLVLGGNSDPSEADVKKVLTEAGATADADQVSAICKACSGKAFNELVAEGLKKVGSCGAGAPAAAAGAAPAKEEKAAEKEEEPEEEEVDMGGFFGGDDDY